MTANDLVLDELVKIRKLLTILAQDRISGFNETIKNKFLTTPEREAMYELFDGTKSLKEISLKVNTTSEAVRLLALALEKDGLIEYEQINAKTKYPKRIF